MRNITRLLSICIVAIAINVAATPAGALPISTPSHAPVNSIQWMGHTWDVTDYAGTQFYPDQVWVDSSGWLHLKLIYDNGKWKWFNLIQRDPARYGTYSYVIDTDVDYIQDTQDGGNPNFVFSPFLFDNSLASMNNGEIDIEMCKWGNPGMGSNTDWTIHSNNHAVQYNHFTGAGNTHTLTWTPQQIKFTVQGPSQPYKEYVFTDTSKIPPDTGKMQHILHLGQKDDAAPVNGASHYEVELVLRSYTYSPFQTDLASKSTSTPEPTSAQSPTARSSGIFTKMAMPTNMFSSMPFSSDPGSGQTQGQEAQASSVSATDSLWSGTSKPFKTNFKWPLAL